MKIIKDENKYYVHNSLNIINELEAKNYIFNFDVFGRCFLEDGNNFKFPDIIYDVDIAFRQIVKKVFLNNNSNLGVLLTGNKGQGKSITAKLIAKELNLPIVIIDKPIPNKIDFIKFLKEIENDYILFIDEFEKLFLSNSYDESVNSNHTQESFLTFMDGVNTTNNKILFLLTTNENINEYLINRPSRIKFLKDYNELPEELFEKIVDNLLIKKEYREDLEKNTSFLNLNIDLLISIIKDINLLDQPFSTFSNVYNYRLENYMYELYVIKKDGIKRYERLITHENKINLKDKYIGGYRVDNFIKFTKNEIEFETTWEDDDGKYEIVVIKLIPFTNKKKVI